MRETGNNEFVSSSDRKGEQKHGMVSKGDRQDLKRGIFFLWEEP